MEYAPHRDSQTRGNLGRTSKGNWKTDRSNSLWKGKYKFRDRNLDSNEKFENWK